MARGLLDALGLFCLPFLVYAVALALGRRYPWLRRHWPGRRVLGLAVAGLGLVALGLVGVGLLSPRHQGAYRPAHVEGGRLVPGQME